jgi:hypothetical protein
MRAICCHHAVSFGGVEWGKEVVDKEYARRDRIRL